MPGIHLSTIVKASQAPVPSTSTSAFPIHIARSASMIPLAAWASFRLHPGQSNVMYPYALKELHREKSGQVPTEGNTWITLSSNETVDFVLSCTDGPVGQYPVFIYTPHPLEALTTSFLAPRMLALVDALLTTLPTQRVYSVFAPHTISETFVELWTYRTGIESLPEAYYDSTLSFCTKQSLVKRQNSLGPGDNYKFEMRLASLGDIPKVADLCFQFSATCAPFTLTPERATFEAELLIRAGQMWVHTMHLEGQEPQIASILAVTRTSDTVAAITKVFTSPLFRRRACAERLTRHVCKFLLQKRKKVVLFVGNDNPASYVYKKVGFVGLKSIGAVPVEGCERWVETGFDTSKVVLGHW